MSSSCNSISALRYGRIQQVFLRFAQQVQQVSRRVIERVLLRAGQRIRQRAFQRILCVLWTGALAAMIAGVAIAAEPPAAPLARPIKVVTTTTIVQDLVEQVAGDRAEVWSLLRPGMDPHAHQAVPADLVALAQADVIFVHGAGLDAWADRLVARSEAPVFVVTQGIEAALEVLSHAGHQESSQAAPRGEGPQAGGGSGGRGPSVPGAGGEHDHAPGERDPHFWFDPILVKHYVTRIEDGLAAVDPHGAAAYRENAEAYRSKLDELDAWIRERVAEVPPGRRKLVTNHDTLGYFAGRYGFEVIGSVIPSFNPEAESSARQLAQLVRSVRELGVSVVFTETTFNPRLAEAVAREAGGSVRVVALYTDSLSGPGGPAATYLDMMRHNVNSIVDALK